MNHLNLFHLYSHDENRDPIENNLTRALAICLKNDSLLLGEFIRHIVQSATPQNIETILTDLFFIHNNEPAFELQMQAETRRLANKETAPEKIYAVALTTRNLDMSGFHNLSPTNTKENRNITDLAICLGNTLFIIEVKRSAEDCRQQLYNQIDCFEEKEKIIPVSFSWEQVLRILLRVKSIHGAIGKSNYTINDFITLLDTHYADWLPPVPFSHLPFNMELDSIPGKRLQRRLYQAMAHAAAESGYLVQNSRGRISFKVNFGWANEVQPYFTFEEGKAYLGLYIWPANTKTQGYYIYTSPKGLDWTRKKNLVYKGLNYEVSVSYEVKFCHFNAFVSQVVYEDPAELIQPLHTTENYRQSGQYFRENWPFVINWLDSHFPATFDWKKAAGWQVNFEDSKRSYVTISLGFEVCLLLPYEQLQKIDQKEEGYREIAKILLDGIDALKTLID